MTDKELFADQQNVSRETLERLQIYEDVLRKWTSKINLVAKSTVDSVWSRHFLDSAQVFDAIPQGSENLSDFGSGGGFPGLVIAAIAAEKLPNLSVSLIESDVRKASFLSTAAREMGLKVNIHAKRVEDIAPLSSDVVTARALAPLADLFIMTERHLRPDGTGLFLKGEQHLTELDRASKVWEFDVTTQQSKTNPSSALLTIKKLKRAA